MISPGREASGAVVAEDADLELPAGDALLDEGRGVVSESEVERGRQGAGLLDLGDADARAEVGRLDEERQGQGPADAAEDLAGVRPPFRFADGERGDDGQPAVAEDRLGQDLVHAQRRAEDAGPDVGDAGHLEQALDRPVLAEGAVENGKVDVDGRPGAGRARLPGQEGEGGAGLERREAGRRGLDGLPAAVPGDVNGPDVVRPPVQVPVDGAGRDEGNLVFGRPSPEDQANDRFFRHSDPRRD